MSFLVRSLSRERARSGEVREGRHAALREIVTRRDGARAAINWVALSQLLNLVQHKGSIPESVRKCLKELLASPDLTTSLHALTIVDTLALNCPDARVRQQLAGHKWAKRLAQKASGKPSSVHGSLVAALRQLLVNWSLVFSGSELAEAVDTECQTLASLGVEMPVPSQVAYERKEDVALGASANSFLHGLDFARHFEPSGGTQGGSDSPAPSRALRNPQGNTGDAMPQARTTMPSFNPAEPPAETDSERRRTTSGIGEEHLAQPSGSHTPANSGGRSPGTALQQLKQSWKGQFPPRRSAGSSSGRDTPSSLSRTSPVDTPVHSASSPGDQGTPDALATSACDVSSDVDRSVAEVEQAVVDMQRDKARLEAASDECRAAVVRHNSGQTGQLDLVIEKTEAGWEAAAECETWGGRIRALAVQDLPDDLLSKLLQANDSLTSQLQRWHRIQSNPIVQAALSATDSQPGTTASRSMHLLDLPGVYNKSQARSIQRATTAPNSPSHLVSESGSASVRVSREGPALEAQAVTDGARVVHSSGPNKRETIHSFIHHKRSLSSPASPTNNLDNLETMVSGGSHDGSAISNAMAQWQQQALETSTQREGQGQPGTPGTTPEEREIDSGAQPTPDTGPRPSDGGGVVATPQGDSEFWSAIGTPAPVSTERTLSILSSTATPASASERGWSTATTFSGHHSPFSGEVSPYFPSAGNPSSQSISRQLSEYQDEAVCAVSAARQPTGNGSNSQGDLSALQKHVDKLLEQLTEAWQTKATAQKEMADHLRARLAAEREASTLRQQLLSDRVQAEAEIGALRSELVTVKTLAVERIKQLMSSQQAAVAAGSGTQGDSSHLQAELTRARASEASLRQELESCRATIRAQAQRTPVVKSGDGNDTSAAADGGGSGGGVAGAARGSARRIVPRRPPPEPPVSASTSPTKEPKTGDPMAGNVQLTDADALANLTAGSPM